MTAALEGDEWSAARPGRTFTPRKDPVPIVQEAGWASGSVWTGGKSRPHRDSIPDRPARSQSLYRLSYRATRYEIQQSLLQYTIKYLTPSKNIYLVTLVDTKSPAHFQDSKGTSIVIL